MRPEIDREMLATCVSAWLNREGLSYRAAGAVHPGLNTAMLSRAINGHVLSAANLLSICKAMEEDPLRFLQFASGRQQNQTVTAIDKRETEAHPYG